MDEDGTSGGAAGELRTTPQQERSRRRYAKIVDAAAELFADAGFDGTTMDAIANAAQTSIGSVYRFFPNKRAVFRAVAEQALEGAAQTFAAAMAKAGAGLAWHELLNLAIDSFAALHRDDPASRAIFANLQLYGDYAEADERLTREFIAATAGIMAGWAPSLDAEQREVAATVVVNTVFGNLLLAEREGPERAAALHEHTKIMLRRYLEPWVADGLK